MKNSPSVPLAIFILLAIGLTCICCCSALLLLSARTPAFLSNLFPAVETPTAIVIRPPDQSVPNSPPPTPALHFPVLAETLRILEETTVPMNNPLDLAQRLEGKTNVPETVPPPSAPLQVGAQDMFWASDIDTNENFQISATLRYITDHAYFWVDDGVTTDPQEVQELMETFENRIYPTNRAFFGSEWTPGVDGDPHIYILYARGLGDSIAGFFSTTDEFHPLVYEFSNAHEMFFINADTSNLTREFTYAVLAHEFQHMIHWNRDRNEDTWLNEGFSDLAMLLNNYSIGGFDFLYATDPDLQLNNWPDDPDQTAPHYGASFLFVAYFLDRFGEAATRALVAHPDNGLTSLDTLLAEMGARDPLTGKLIDADDVFLDWVLATYLQNGAIEDGQFSYSLVDNPPQPANIDTITSCPLSANTRTVNQYGVDYIKINCRGDYDLLFEGSIQAAVVPTEPHSGKYFFWSNTGDESDMTLTQTFDFREQNGPLTMTYWTWYDLEEEFDYVYVEASVDGLNWETLVTPSGTGADPTGANYGWGYNGVSGGGPQWIQESVDLSPFAGNPVQIRFEYITDATTNGEGFLLDDIAIPEIGYSSDFEQDKGGWQPEGFVRIDNILPQTYRLALISFGDAIKVNKIQLQDDLTAEIPLNIGGEVEEVILVVTGTTRFTRQIAPYRFAIQP